MSAYKQFNEYLKSINANYDIGMQDALAGLKGGTAGLTRDQTQSLIHQDMMANTQYQRSVQDMQAAGLNPALIYNSAGSPAPVSSTPSSNMGQRFETIANAMMLPAQLAEIYANIKGTKAQIDVARSQADVNRATADNIGQQARNNKLNADFLEDTFEERKKTPKLGNDMTLAQTRAVYRGMDKMDKEMDLLVKQAATEEERKVLVYWQGQVEKANAEQIVALLPYEIEFKKAATQAQKAAAAASFTHAAYEQGMIDSGYIDNLAEEVKARAHSAEEQALALEYANALKTGNITEFLNKVTGGTVPVGDGFVAAIMMVSSMIGNTLGGIFK